MGKTKCFDRNDVLDQAIQSFWKNGYASTSLSDLEKSTGVNKSGLYSEFKDKDDLFFECVKRYRETSPATEILLKKPLGLKNIEIFLKSSLRCTGQRGCFLANTTREYSIIPDAVKKLLGKNYSDVCELLSLNLKEAGFKNSAQVATLIVTFSMGISLKLNAVDVSSAEVEIDNFLKLLKKN